MRTQIVLEIEFPQHDDIAGEVAYDFTREAIEFWQDRFSGEEFNIHNVSVRSLDML